MAFSGTRLTTPPASVAGSASGTASPASERVPTHVRTIRRFVITGMIPSSARSQLAATFAALPASFLPAHRTPAPIARCPWIPYPMHPRQKNVFVDNEDQPMCRRLVVIGSLVMLLQIPVSLRLQ
jgi:hypothetical protein